MNTQVLAIAEKVAKGQINSCQLSLILEVEAKSLQLGESRGLWKSRIQELSELDERSS